MMLAVSVQNVAQLYYEYLQWNIQFACLRKHLNIILRTPLTFIQLSDFSSTAEPNILPGRTRWLCTKMVRGHKRGKELLLPRKNDVILSTVLANNTAFGSSMIFTR